ncbi:MAG: Ig-like domain repeat protein, partial [Nitrososphaerota archaeon]|nr:Ig-like domain repeat protein [Nitrososphaerota archaeon]
MTRVNIRRPARAQAFALAALFIVSTISPLVSSVPGSARPAQASSAPGPEAGSAQSKLSPLTQGATSTSVSCSPGTTPVPSGSTGSATNCQAVVSGSSPTGTVTFTSSSSTGTFSFGVSFGSSLACTLSSGSCSVSYSDSVAGTPTITATYGGDSNNLASAGNFVLTVSGTVALTLSPSSGLAGATVTVSGSGFAAGAPISVDFAGSSVSTSGSCITSSTSGSLGVLPASNGCSFAVPSTAQTLPVVTAFDDVGD